MSLFFGINIAVKGMMAQQTALQVTSHNIANANTDGYSRQRVNLEASAPISGVASAGQLGSGVDVAEVTRMRDLFLDYQVRKETASMENQQAVYETLQLAETVFMEPGDNGFNNKLEEFWNAWQELAKYPESSPVRTALKEACISLTDTIRQMHTQLSDIKLDIQSQMELAVKDVNSIASRIARLNEQIVNVKMTGQSPNDLYDKRDLALDQLAAIGNITVTDQMDANGEATGAITVKLAGVTIVDGTNHQDISSEDINSLAVKDGRLAGLLQASGSNGRSDSVQYYIDKLDTLAVSMAKIINDIHHTGVDISGEAGEDFFIFQDAGGEIIDLTTVDWDQPLANGLSAANIFVAPEISGNVSRIAAAQAGEIHLEGNGETALRIAQLRDTRLHYDDVNKMLQDKGGGDITVGMFYQNMITDMGSAAAEAEKRMENQMTLVDQIATRRESMQGVQIDEELANMVLYKHSFDASAKVISIIDEMLNTIINGLKA